MTAPDLDSKLDRINDFVARARHDSLARNLMHAYTACLTAEETCAAILRCLEVRTEILPTIRNRLFWLGRNGIGHKNITELAHRLVDLTTKKPQARVRIDAILSHLYPFLDPPTRHTILEYWRDRGSRSADARWLKAIAEDEYFFSTEMTLNYWRITGDPRAAKLLAQRAEPAILTEILPELLVGCDEGWIISRVALRAISVTEEDWAKIRTKFPATYAYLCARTGRTLEEKEAMNILMEVAAVSSDDRVLVIWAIGQVGLWSVLEQVEAIAPELRRLELEHLGIIGYRLQEKQEDI